MLDWCTWLACWGTGSLCEGPVGAGCSVSGTSGIIHKPVCVHFLHCIVGTPLLCTSHEMSLITTLHPALQSSTTDTKEYDANPGTRWASLVLGGSCGSVISAVWLDLMNIPPGSLIRSGFVARFLPVNGAAERRKWLDAPESRMPHFILFCVLVDAVRNKVLAA